MKSLKAVVSLIALVMILSATGCANTSQNASPDFCKFFDVKTFELDEFNATPASVTAWFYDYNCMLIHACPDTGFDPAICEVPPDP